MPLYGDKNKVFIDETDSDSGYLEDKIYEVWPVSQIGHVLMSTDGLTFTVECPLTADGWLVNDNGIMLVVG